MNARPATFTYWRGTNASFYRSAEVGQRSSWIAGGAAILWLVVAAAACGDRRALAEGHMAAPPNDSVYVLVMIDDRPLPWLAPRTARDGCRKTVLQGWMRIGGGRWTASDSVITECSAANARRSIRADVQTGRISTVQGSLVFEIWGQRQGF